MPAPFSVTVPVCNSRVRVVAIASVVVAVVAVLVWTTGTHQTRTILAASTPPDSRDTAAGNHRFATTNRTRIRSSRAPFPLQLLPDPVILPVPRSGDERNPYFVNITIAKPLRTRSNQKPTPKVLQFSKTTVLQHRSAAAAAASLVRVANSATGIDDSALLPYDSEHRGYYLVTTNHPWSVVLPDSGTLPDPRNSSSSNNSKSNGSGKNNPDRPLASRFLQTTSQQAADNDCDVVATNGGPFDPGGVWNSGPTVRKGRLVRTKPDPEDSDFVGFGIALETAATMTMAMASKDHGNSSSKTSRVGAGDDSIRKHWILGTYGQLVPLSSANGRERTIWDFVTGFGWLVYDGRSRVEVEVEGDQGTTHPRIGTGRAPRTAIGLDRNSNIMLLVVDGCEHCLSRKGLTLDELADLFVRLGAVYAVNMDGGGSSTMAMPMLPTLRDNVPSNGKTTAKSFTRGSTDEPNDYVVINRPTCLDLPFPYCQRAVSTVLCVSSNQQKRN